MRRRPVVLMVEVLKGRTTLQKVQPLEGVFTEARAGKEAA